MPATRLDANGGHLVSRRTLTALLTSASLSTLTLASIGRVSAATVTVAGPNAPVTVPANFDFINVEASDISTFTNNNDIKDGYDNPDTAAKDAVAIHVRSNSTIDSFVNGLVGNITAIEGTAA